MASLPWDFSRLVVISNLCTLRLPVQLETEMGGEDEGTLGIVK